MTIGSKVMLINGAAITMDTAPEISNDCTMLPVRFRGQALGAEFVWDEATQTVTVTSNIRNQYITQHRRARIKNPIRALSLSA